MKKAKLFGFSLIALGLSVSLAHVVVAKAKPLKAAVAKGMQRIVL